MHIVYAAATCSEAVYRKLYEEEKNKPSFQAQKYHRLFIEGLAAHTKVDVVCYPPSNASVMKTSTIDLPEETAGGADYHYIRVHRNPIRKLVHVTAASFFRCLKQLDRDSAVMVDCLNQAVSFGALLASKVKRCRCVGILTDLPEFQGGGAMMALSNFVIRHCTDYVVMTEAMNTYVNSAGKPHVVLEGHSDITMASRTPSLEAKGGKRICLYAGSIHEIYGIKRLVEGFRMAAIPGLELHIYGSGDYLPELERIAAEDSSVFYGGMLLPSQVVEKEMQATLLVNPRPTDEEYVKYSFPSKTMEYMSTGTPVLTTVLPGLPEEYYPYVSFIREETPEGIAKALAAVFAHTDEELFAMGAAARSFILKERSNVVQAGKVLAMLEGNGQ